MGFYSSNGISTLDSDVSTLAVCASQRYVSASAVCASERWYVPSSIGTVRAEHGWFPCRGAIPVHVLCRVRGANCETRTH